MYPFPGAGACVDHPLLKGLANQTIQNSITASQHHSITASQHCKSSVKRRFIGTKEGLNYTEYVAAVSKDNKYRQPLKTSESEGYKKSVINGC